MARAAGAIIVVIILVGGALFLIGRQNPEALPPWLASLIGEVAAPAEVAATAPVAETPAPATPAAPEQPAAETPATPPAAEPPAPETAAAPATPAPAETPATPSDTAATPAETAPAAQAEGTPAEPNPATFDVARVEPSGEAVLAGRADPNSIVVLYANGREIARTQANANGEWVVTLEKPLAPGEYELMIVTASPDGARQIESRERLAVSVPQAAGEQPMVALVAPDSPARVLQQPDAPAADAGETAAESVTVTTVARDGDQITVTGRAPADARLRVYFDDAPLGDAKAGADGVWSVTAAHPAGPGRHSVRVDQLSPEGTVVARSEVPFEVIGETDVAAAEAEPTPADATDAGVADGSVVPPAQAPDAEAPARPATIRIRRGDDLWSIAERYYGSGVRYTAIYRANRRQIRNPDLIYPGQVFTLPN